MSIMHRDLLRIKPYGVDVAYIQMNDGAYLDTGIPNYKGTQIHCTFEFPSLGGSGSYVDAIVTCKKTGSYDIIVLQKLSNTYFRYYEKDAPSHVKNLAKASLGKHTFVKTGSLTYTFDGVEGKIQQASTDYTDDYHLLIGCTDVWGNYYKKSTVRIYNFGIVRDDVTTMELIPVIDHDGVPCMYDLVGGKHYYNAADVGSFSAG